MSQKPYIIVLGNEKGGTGKSTVSMHVLVHLLRLGFKVGSIDLDARQGTLTRYLDNRQKTIEREEVGLPMPVHFAILKSQNLNVKEAEKEEQSQFEECMKRLGDRDVILIDTPGNDTFLSRLAHSYAETLITPLNDSFIDLDMLARVNSETQEIERPSTYSEMVWDQRKQRAMRGDRSNFDWIVVRNRLSSIHAKNKAQMQELLSKLAKRIGFRVAAGFGERVIFRELFLRGLTLLDLGDMGIPFSVSHVTARHELRMLLEMINLPLLDEKLAKAS